jgi:hypothetical protein
LKVGYGRQAEILMCSWINHITKLEFLPTSKLSLTLLSQRTIFWEGFEALAYFDIAQRQ